MLPVSRFFPEAHGVTYTKKVWLNICDSEANAKPISVALL